MLGHSQSLKPLDEMDRRVLQLLQENGRMTNAEIARRVNLSTPGLQKRLKKLEKARVIEGYMTRVNRKALGLDLLCFVQVSLTPQQQPERMGQFCDRMQGLSEVLECHHLTGELDYLLKVVVTDRQHLERFLFETIAQLPGVDKIQTRIVINEIKTSTALPLNC